MSTERDEDGAAGILRRLLVLMDLAAEVSTAPGDEPGNTWLKISTSAGGLLIGRHGQTLDSARVPGEPPGARSDDDGLSSSTPKATASAATASL